MRDDRNPNRRQFLGAVAGVGALAFWSRSRSVAAGFGDIPSRFLGDAIKRGHRLREFTLDNLPVDARRHARVLVFGAGIAGLAAARRLRSAGIEDLVVFDLEDTPFGLAQRRMVASNTHLTPCIASLCTAPGALGFLARVAGIPPQAKSAALGTPYFVVRRGLERYAGTTELIQAAIASITVNGSKPAAMPAGALALRAAVSRARLGVEESAAQPEVLRAALEDTAAAMSGDGVPMDLAAPLLGSSLVDPLKERLRLEHVIYDIAVAGRTIHARVFDCSDRRYTEWTADAAVVALPPAILHRVVRPWRATQVPAAETTPWIISAITLREGADRALRPERDVLFASGGSARVRVVNTPGGATVLVHAVPFPMAQPAPARARLMNFLTDSDLARDFVLEELDGALPGAASAAALVEMLVVGHGSSRASAESQPSLPPPMFGPGMGVTGAISMNAAALSGVRSAEAALGSLGVRVEPWS